MHELKGICPIIATPFTRSGGVDLDSFRNLVQVLIRGGCHAVTLFGIAGEYYKLSEDECRRLAAITVEECRKSGVPSILSVTRHATELAVRQAKEFEDMGANYLMLLPPFFLKPGASDLYEHMKKVGKAVSIPVIAQYAPEQTGVAIAPDVFARLNREVENISYYKIECKPAGGYVSSLLSQTHNKVSVFVGNAGYQFVECFDRGAVGVMPGCSMYDIYLKMYNQYVNGDRTAAIRTHSEAILPILNHIRQNVEMIIYYKKRILHKRGIIDHDFCRHPTFKPDEYYDGIFEEFYRMIEPYFEQ